MHPSRSSLRNTLVLLVFLAVLPAVVLILGTAWEQRRQAVAGAREDALRLARVAAADHEQIIEGARSLLVGLAQLPSVQTHHTTSCSALFAEVRRQFPLYSNIGAVRADGQVFCTVRPARGRDNVADQPFFQGAMARGEFTVGGYAIDPLTGQSTVTLAYPAIDASGVTWAVVFAELDLGWLRQLGEKSQLTRGTVISVIDTTGLVLARYPDPGNWTGRTAPGWTVISAIRNVPAEGTLEAMGLEGEPRIFGWAPLFDPRRGQPLTVIVGIPRTAALADADKLLNRNLLWAGLVFLLVLVAAVVVSDLLILRRVHAVVRAARRLTAGDLSARVEVRGSDEIGVMARTFNGMAERLQARVIGEQAIKEGLAERVGELRLLNHMGELFQACLTMEEAYGVIARLATQLFPRGGGAVFALQAGHDLLEAVATWGPAPAGALVLSADQCWALRNGRSHVVEDTTAGVLCSHLPTPPPAAYLCTPLTAQGSSLGVLYVASEPSSASEPPAGLSQPTQRLAEAVAAQLALGLANVQLRDILRSQSIHDPLTGLFNRRYMQETLEREVHRARRSQRPLGVLMADIDGFKQQNDAFGHDAGDAVLRALARLLQSSLRREDIASRFGGEEFVLVLPDAAIEAAGRRAEQLRLAASELHVVHGGQTLGPITISVGVAAFPDHGVNAETLLKAADLALYQAKRDGKNRVSVSGPAAHPPSLL